MRFFVRGAQKPVYHQDEETLMIFGRWYHFFNVEDNRWVCVRHRVAKPWGLERPGCDMEELYFWKFLKRTGLRGLLEVLEDLTRQRLVSRWIQRKQGKRELSAFGYDDRAPLDPEGMTRDFMGGALDHGELFSPGGSAQGPDQPAGDDRDGQRSS